jgi:hypothetical protein
VSPSARSVPHSGTDRAEGLLKATKQRWTDAHQADGGHSDDTPARTTASTTTDITKRVKG